jgi:TP901 family phage tail tape measure protein
VALADTARLIVELALNDKFSAPMKNAQSQLTQLQRSGEQVGKGIRQVGTGFTQLGTRAAVVAATGLTAVVKTAIDFESAFAGVAKTVEATPAQLEELNSGFRELARTIPLSFEEFAAIGEQAGALGIARQDILEFTEVVAMIGTTTDVASEDAATALGQLSNVLGLTAEDFDNFGAALVDLGNKGASTESTILQITSRAGAGAKLIGLTAAETLAWASAVANLGVEAEAGGSALQQFTLESAKSLETTKGLTVMAETAGTTGAAFKRAFEKDASGALQTFLKGLGKLDRGAQLEVLDDLGLRGTRLQRVLLGLANDNDNLADSLDNSKKAWEENTALTEEAEKRYATTASKLQVLKNNVRDAANTIGSELLPVVADLATEFADFLQKPENVAKIREFAQELGQGARDMVAAFKRGEFQPFIDSLKGAAGVAKVAFDAFNALPGPIKQVAIAAALANKATGGAVGLIASGATNIFRGLIGLGGGLLSKGGSPANPLFTKEVGFAGGPGGLPGAGGGGGIFGTLLKATLVGAVAVGIAEGLNQFVRTVDPGFLDRKAERPQFSNPFKGPIPVKVVNPGTPQGQFNRANLGGTPKPVVVKGAPLDALNIGIRTLRDQVRKDLAAGDLHAARIGQQQLDSLQTLRGTFDRRISDLIPHLGRVNSALSTANRNLQDGNARQRETAARISEARAAIGTGFQSSNEKLGVIASKDFSTQVDVSIPVTSNVIISDIIRNSVTYNKAVSWSSQVPRSTNSGFTSR